MISVLIPEELLLEPPIARHHHDADQRHLTPLEFAIGIELLRAAHAARVHKRGRHERTAITFSRYALLRGAELSPNPENLARVAGAIGRLQQPVGDMPPLILAAGGANTRPLARHDLAPLAAAAVCGRAAAGSTHASGAGVAAVLAWGNR